MSSVGGCFDPNSVCLGNLYFLVGSHGYVFFNGPRVCPRLMVVLTQTLFVWAICIFLGGSQG